MESGGGGSAPSSSGGGGGTGRAVAPGPPVFRLPREAHPSAAGRNRSRGTEVTEGCRLPEIPAALPVPLPVGSFPCRTIGSSVRPERRRLLNDRQTLTESRKAKARRDN
ncbi:hypothetical protein GRJ2_000584300 [Grus japonensis]|uniref:Uncharacterized protein n=1 Tax=Grus japonensis TaxID=30415 RepID=A0ABC9W759_GRUJA